MIVFYLNIKQDINDLAIFEEDLAAKTFYWQPWTAIPAYPNITINRKKRESEFN